MNTVKKQLIVFCATLMMGFITLVSQVKASCNFMFHFGSSVNHITNNLKGEFGQSILPYDRIDVFTDWENQCGSHTDMEAGVIEYMFLNNKLVQLRIINQSNKEPNLVDWSKKEYGEPDFQLYTDESQPMENHYLWFTNDSDVGLDYFIYSEMTDQILTITSTKYETLLSSYSAKMEDPDEEYIRQFFEEQMKKMLEKNLNAQ